MDPKIVVIYDNSSASLQLVKRATVVKSGQIFKRERFKRLGYLSGESTGPGDVLSYGRVPWESILRDTFGRPFRDLLDGGSVTSFGVALGCVARIFTVVLTDCDQINSNAYNLYRKHWKYINSSSHGRGFLNTIQYWLPELAASDRLRNAMERGLEATHIEAVAMYESTMQLIRASCMCQTCSMPEEDSPRSKKAPKSEFCQVVLIITIAKLVQVLSCIMAPIAILPTRAGLETLYWSNDLAATRKTQYLDQLLSQRESYTAICQSVVHRP